MRQSFFLKNRNSRVERPKCRGKSIKLTPRMSEGTLYGEMAIVNSVPEENILNLENNDNDNIEIIPENEDSDERIGILETEVGLLKTQMELLICDN